MKISYLLMIFLLAACSPQAEQTEEAQNTTEPTLPETAELAESPPTIKECSLLLGFDAWEPYRMEEFSLYVRSGEQDDLNFTTLTEFVNSGSKIGVVAEYLYGDEVARLVDDPETSNMFVNAIMGELNVARLMFSQQSVTPEQLAAFNTELNRVKTSGAYDDLIAKYSY